MANTSNTRKKISAEGSTAIAEKKITENSEKMYSADEVKDIVAEAIKNAMSEYAKNQPQQQIVQVTRDEYVTVLYLDNIAEGSTVRLGKLGTINGAGVTLDIPKKEFLQGMNIPVVNALLRQKKLLVIDGLTDEERERFQLVYGEEEILSQNAFYKLLNYPVADLRRMFTALCDDHKKIVAKMFLSAYFEKSDPRVTPEKVKMLNKISREIDDRGLLTPVLEDMGRRFTEE